MNNTIIKKRNKHFKYLPFYFLIILINSCVSLPKEFNSRELLETPDYSLEKNWAALPFRKDKADNIPRNEAWIPDSLKPVDVFYLYPTFYTKGKTWNADINNKSLNRKIDRFPLKLQATAFNRIGRVYAPRYRQAHIDSYFDETGGREKTLKLAYEDVKNAFDHFLEYYNDGRPIVIAGHSQGSEHCKKILKEYFDNEFSKHRLVAAYIVGISVFEKEYKVLEPCEYPEDINCYMTWASYQKGYYPNDNNLLSLYLRGNVCVNPISWTRDEHEVTGKGGLIMNLSQDKYKVKCQAKSNYLWVDTNMIFFRRKHILHTVDYNLFWHDIRENASVRTEHYLNESTKRHDKKNTIHFY
jgi:hypothetical protein